MVVTPVSQRGYAHPELLVETDWLAANLQNPALRIIDTRAKERYDAGHIPGAASIVAAGNVPRADNGDMGTPEEFASLAGALGVDATSEVVLYDAPNPQMGMAAWSFLYYGHPTVRMLDGGLAKWTAEGRLVATDASHYPAANFQPRLIEGLYCSLETAKQSHGRPRTIFWDTRRPAEFGGTEAAGNAADRLGHIPGAVHLEWSELLEPDSQTFKPATELRALLESRGITPDVAVTTY
jgi:thiosulfate/3-mercaptopyruvate sulfurtransferase